MSGGYGLFSAALSEEYPNQELIERFAESFFSIGLTIRIRTESAPNGSMKTFGGPLGPGDGVGAGTSPTCRVLLGLTPLAPPMHQQWPVDGSRTQALAAG